MYVADLRYNTIHDLGCPRYECHIHNIPEDQKKKLYTLEAVKRLCDTDSVPRFQGCQYCLPDYYNFDMNKIF
ncbi:MAG: hypothetical protein NTW14_12675 [bacterium]|nr:hypothetical protein [bacterium]